MSFELAPGLNLSGHSLFLDLDGTIAAFAIKPSSIGPDRRRTALLQRLGVILGGRLAIISGRPIVDIDRILEHSATAVAGTHGLELRTRNAQSYTRPHPAIRQTHRAFMTLAADHPGVIVEMKGSSVALHYRARPDLAGALARAVADLHCGAGLILQVGDMVLELMTPGPDKGDALRAFMAEAPFAGARPIFLGDDVTDESAFRAAEALGGFGVRVGPPRPTAARYRLDDVDHALSWLDSLGRGAPEPRQERTAAYV